MLWVDDLYAPDGSRRTPAQRLHPASAGQGPWATNPPLPDYWTLLASLPGVLAALVDNMAPPGGYLHRSALHDPLTVIHALTVPNFATDVAHLDQGDPPAGAVLTVVPARLTMDSNARWAAVAVPAAVWASTHAACATAGGVEGDLPRQQWWQAVGARYEQLVSRGQEPELEQSNCFMSWGPPTAAQVAEFWSRLRAAFA
jgi:hypothetical protein